MRTGRICGYCRDSSKKQNIERQVRNILAIYPDAIIIKEVILEFLQEQDVNTEFFRQALNNQINIHLSTGNAATDHLHNAIVEALN